MMSIRCLRVNMPTWMSGYPLSYFRSSGLWVTSNLYGFPATIAPGFFCDLILLPFFRYKTLGLYK